MALTSISTLGIITQIQNLPYLVCWHNLEY